MTRRSATGNTVRPRTSRASVASSTPLLDSVRESGQQPSFGRKGKTKPITAGDTPKNAVTEKRSYEIDPKTLAGLRRLPNRQVADLIIGALKHGMRHRITTKGIMLYGDNGESTTIHFSNSDSRAHLNIKKHLRQLGYEPGRK
jgi:hypothetical protein